MDTTEIEKVCPFCEEVFSVSVIKVHIGVNHLGIPLEKIENDTSANEVVDSPNIKKEPSDELSFNQTESKESIQKPEKSEKSFQCNLCNKLFDVEQRLKYHIQIVRENKGKFACDQCSKVYPFEFKLKEHMNIVHLGKVPTCSICDKKFKSSWALKLHSKSIHNIKALALQCDNCDRLFWNKTGLKRHLIKCRQSGRNKLESNGPANNLESDQPVDQNEITDIEMKPSEEGKNNDISTVEKESKPEGINPGKSNSGGKRYQCEQCDKSYAFPYDLKTHVRDIHELSLTFRCDLCGQNFETKKSLKVHKIIASCQVSGKKSNLDRVKKVKNLSRGKRYQCAQCHKSYAFRSDYKNHVRVKHEGLTIRCDLCDKKFTKKSSLKVHKIMVHKSNVSKVSNKKLKSLEEESNLAKHQTVTDCQIQKSPKKQPFVLLKRLSKEMIDGYEPKQPIQMSKVAIPQPRILMERLSPKTIELWTESQDQATDLDAKDDENIFDLTLVLNLKDSDNKDMEVDNSLNHSFLCMHCNKRFKTRNHLVHHDQTVHQKKRYNADLSSKTDTTQQIEKQSKRRFECEKCEKKFNLKGKLNQHILLVHTKSMIVKGKNMGWCEVCQKAFGNLPQHKKLIHEKIRYSCDTCPKSFSTLQWLKIHIDSSHRGITFECEHCGKKFNDKRGYKRHAKKYHLNEHFQTEAKGTKPKSKNDRKFPCDSCQRVFNSRPGLKHHKQVVHEKLRFSCADCLKTFTSKQSFTKHRCETANE